MSEIQKVIVSHKRADNLLTHKVVNDCVVCIPQSQYDEYKEWNPDLEIVCHPDEVVGLSPKRQWIYDKFGDVFMLDDDIMRMTMVNQSGSEKSKVLNAQEISDLIDDMYHMAKECGVFLFGFNRRANPVGYTGASPIKLRSFITGGAFGIIKGSQIYFPDYWDFVGEDYWVNAINAYFHRKCLVDERFAFEFAETEHRQGGVSDYRTEERRKETYLYLKKHFGNSIIPKRPSPIKPNIMKWEKTLKIKF